LTSQIYFKFLRPALEIPAGVPSCKKKDLTMKHLLTSVLSFAMIFSITTCFAQNKLSQALSKPAGVTKLKIEYTPIANLPPAIGKQDINGRSKSKT
jgi:hypothetical protein